MTSEPGEPFTNDPGDGAPEEPRPEEPKRKPLNGFGWLGFGLSAVSFLASISIGWSGAILVAVVGAAFALSGLVRSNRGRATNGRYAFAGLILAVVTIGLAFVWSARAQECRPLLEDETKFEACYKENAGLL